MNSRVMRNWIAAVVLVLSAVPSIGQEVGAESPESLDVRGMSLEQALSRLATARRMELVLAPYLVEGKRSSCMTKASGDAEALRCVLAGTGLIVEELRNGVYVIKKGPDENAKTKPRLGSLAGQVFDTSTDDPLPGVHVRLIGTPKGIVSDVNGRFRIEGIRDGTYSIVASMVGFETNRKDGVEIASGEETTVRLDLSEKVISLRDIVVTPGRFSVGQHEAIRPQELTQEELRTVPQLGDDVYRAVTRLPGVGGSDFSAKFNVRGGEHREVLVSLDGMTLYEPFHLKDVDGGVLSAIDIEAIGGIDMMTGAFPASYGDRMSGVFNMTSSSSGQVQPRTSLGVGLTNARFVTEGSFAEGAGEYLLLARRGHFDIVLRMVGDDGSIRPIFYDGFAKVKYRLSNRHSVAMEGLLVGDRLTFLDRGAPWNVYNTGYWNRYLWTNWTATWAPNLVSRTIAFLGSVGNDRAGEEYYDEFVGISEEGEQFRKTDLIFKVRGKESQTFVGAKQDWSWDQSSRAVLRWGGEFRFLDAAFDHFGIGQASEGERQLQDPISYDSTRASTARSGQEFSAYVSQKLQLTQQLTTEIGLRFDHMSWSNDSEFSPRLNLAYAIGPQTALRAGWGHFYQAQGLHELQVRDGITNYFPAQRAEHRVVGLEHQFGESTIFRIDLYQKVLSRMRPRFINLSGAMSAFPEVAEDRYRISPTAGDARGFEIYARNGGNGRFSWSGSYGWAKSTETIDGVEVLKGFDQTHTVYLDASFRPSHKWLFTAAFQYHTGWPVTPMLNPVFEADGEGGSISFDFGPLYSDRVPDYHRLDIRANREFRFRKSKLSVYLEARNVYNRQNVRNFYLDYHGDFSSDGRPELVTDQENWFPLMPAFGIRWDLFH